MSHAVRRFGQPRGMALSRPVASNSPLRSCCIDPDFATVAALGMFCEGMPDQLADGTGRPGWIPVVGRLGRANYESVVERVDDNGLPVDPAGRNCSELRGSSFAMRPKTAETSSVPAQLDRRQR